MADAMSINVSTEELRETARKIRTRNDNLQGKLEEMKQKINSLKQTQTWMSDAADEIVAKINGSYTKQRFEQYRDVVETYAQFLVDAAENYERIETNAKTKASSQFK